MAQRSCGISPEIHEAKAQACIPIQFDDEVYVGSPLLIFACDGTKEPCALDGIAFEDGAIVAATVCGVISMMRIARKAATPQSSQWFWVHCTIFTGNPFSQCAD